MIKPRNKYSGEFKLKLVLEHIRLGTTVMAIAKKHNINDKLIRKWKKTYLLDPNNAFVRIIHSRPTKDTRPSYDELFEENMQLKIELSRLEAENKELLDLTKYYNIFSRDLK